MRRVLARILSWRGFTPKVAADRDRGLALIIAERPRVVTLDYDLAGCSALELMRDVEGALGADAPFFVLVSASADRIPRAEQQRFDAVHTKPFRASALLDDVERLASRGERKVSGVVAVGADRERAEGE